MLGTGNFIDYFWNNWKKYIYVENNLDAAGIVTVFLYSNFVSCVAFRKFQFELLWFFPLSGEIS